MNDKNATTPLPGTRAHGIILALLQGGTSRDSEVMKAWRVLVRAVDAAILKKALANSGSGGGLVPLPLQSAPDGLSVEGVEVFAAVWDAVDAGKKL